MHCNKNKAFYALKQISKSKIDLKQIHSNIETEKRIMLKIDHPFIVKLVKTLKDSNNIYLLMEYINGKELFEVLRDIGLLGNYEAQFYGASMILVCNYLHHRKIIYRDIKPENILVSENGYIKLIDFGTSKIIFNRTATVIGTPQYMAPEVIMGEGYSFSVDYWSIGICLFEFICGEVPFGEKSTDPKEIYEDVIFG